MSEYAPIWKNLEDLDGETISEFWVDQFRDHPIDADSSIWQNSISRWNRRIEQYREEGLTGSEVVNISVEKLSHRAVIIHTRWADRVDNRLLSDEPYCGVFIAGKFDEKWMFTNYFTVECGTE